MKITLLGWKASGLRCPDVSVSLEQSGRVPRVVLLQMPNGTGKTTTLNLLRACLTGEAVEWTPDQIIGLRHRDASNSAGSFKVDLRVDDALLTFEINFDFVEGSCHYNTTWGNGNSDGWNPPPRARRFLEKRFVDLFIFDGEFAQGMIDGNRASAREAVQTLFQLYLLHEIRQENQARFDRRTKNATATQETGLAQRQNRVETIETWLAKRSIERDKWELEHSTAKAREASLETKIREHQGTDSKLQERLQKDTDEETRAQGELDDSLVQLLDVTRQPHTLHARFSTDLTELKHQLDRLKLPSSTSARFFDELLEEEDCVCGRPIDEVARRNLEARRNYYLGEESAGVLNALKDDVTQVVEGQGAASPRDLEKAGLALANAIVARDEAATAVRTTRAQLIATGGEQVAQWERELTELREEIRVKELGLKRFDAKYKLGDRLPSSTDKIRGELSIDVLEKALAEARDKLAEITGTMDLRRRTSLLDDILKRAEEIAEAMLMESLRTQCNQQLDRVLPLEPVRIESIGQNLRLLGQDGASVGQSLAVGYTFLTTLLHRGQHQFPLVVDSPANPVDVGNRREIAATVPKLCDHFIGFTISSERMGFANSLHEAADGDVVYLTMFRKSDRTAHLMDSLPETGVHMTDTAVIIEGRDYFNRFDVEED